jgi:hypothetical protein
MKFGNDQIFDMTNFDETSRWMGWSKNEFSHSLAQGCVKTPGRIEG